MHNTSEDYLQDGGTSAYDKLVNCVNLSGLNQRTDSDTPRSLILEQPQQQFVSHPSPQMVDRIMSYSHPNFNPPSEQPQQTNFPNYSKPREYEQYQHMPQFMQPTMSFGWGIHPPPVMLQHIQNPPKIADEKNIAISNNNTMQVQELLSGSPSPPESDHSNSNTSQHSRSNNQERTRPSVIPTTKFINETFDFNRKKRTRRKNKAEKLPDPQLTEMVKDVLKQYELNQKSLALDVGCSETMVSQWINGTAKATGWGDFEAKIRVWMNQEHKKPEKGPAFDFIDESTKLKTKFLRKSKK